MTTNDLRFSVSFWRETTCFSYKRSWLAMFGMQSGVQKNVVFKLRLFGWRVQQKLGIGFFTLDAQLGLDAADMIEPDDVDAVEIECLNDMVELLLLIVLEDDPLVFSVVDCAQGVVELFGVHVVTLHWTASDRRYEAQFG